MGLSENGCIKEEQGKRIWALKYDEIMIGIFVYKIVNEFSKKYIKSLLHFFI